MIKHFVLFAIIVLFLLGARASGQSTLQWSGYRWNVADSGDSRRGPGNNLFSSSEQSVFVDSEGRLHLKIRKRADGKWTCAEIALEDSLSYGTYQWELASRWDAYASNVVVGLFTYVAPKRVAEKAKGKIGNGLPDTPHEIDIEFTKAWGPVNHFFTTHDPDVKSPSAKFLSKPTTSRTTHRFHWTPQSISWESFEGHLSDKSAKRLLLTDRQIGKNFGRPTRHRYTGPVIPEDLDEVPMINFWIFHQEHQIPLVDGPSNNQEHELIIQSFTYVPHATGGK